MRKYFIWITTALFFITHWAFLGFAPNAASAQAKVRHHKAKHPAKHASHHHHGKASAHVRRGKKGHRHVASHHPAAPAEAAPVKTTELPAAQPVTPPPANAPAGAPAAVPVSPPTQ